MIFILGGKGFIGSAFTRFCHENNQECVVIDRQNYSLYKGKKCDVLINANGNPSKILASREPVKDFDASVRSVRNSLVDFQSKKYVLLSSCDVYPDCSSPMLTKEDSKIDVSKQSPYGFHKYLAEECVRHSAKDWIVIRLGGMIGIGLKKNPVFDIIRGGPLWVDPKSQFQYINTDDVAKIVFKLIENGIANEIYNLCGAGLVRIDDIMDTQLKIKSNSPLVKYNVNIEKIQKITKIPDTKNSVLNFIETMREVRSS